MKFTLRFFLLYFLLFHTILIQYYRYREDDEVKYLDAAREIERNIERSTLEINFEDVEKHNINLSVTIIEEYYRVYPYLCRAVANFVKDRGFSKKGKECFVKFTDVPTRHKVRELTMEKLGTLVKITGQVVRTHPVHPELTLGKIYLLTNVRNNNTEMSFSFS